MWYKSCKQNSPSFHILNIARVQWTARFYDVTHSAPLNIPLLLSFGYRYFLIPSFQMPSVFLLSLVWQTKFYFHVNLICFKHLRLRNLDVLLKFPAILMFPPFSYDLLGIFKSWDCVPNYRINNNNGSCSKFVSYYCNVTGCSKIKSNIVSMY
jgi:hypothetical protein